MASNSLHDTKKQKSYEGFKAPDLPQYLRRSIHSYVLAAVAKTSKEGRSHDHAPGLKVRGFVSQRHAKIRPRSRGRKLITPPGLVIGTKFDLNESHCVDRLQSLNQQHPLLGTQNRLPPTSPVLAEGPVSVQ